jgi:hypothetical protein
VDIVNQPRVFLRVLDHVLERKVSVKSVANFIDEGALFGHGSFQNPRDDRKAHLGVDHLLHHFAPL